jgi:transcriptional regulator with XRE-family HTH domain
MDSTDHTRPARDPASPALSGTATAAGPVPGSDPLASRIRLGGMLRAARAGAGITQAQAASRLEWSLSKVIRIEAGISGLSQVGLRALQDLYRIPDEREAELTALARAGRRPSHAWYRQHEAILGRGEGRYLSHESSAAALMEHCTLTIPPLLQTDDYARALLLTFRVPDIAQRLSLLAERRRRLAASAAGAIRYTIDEGVLHRHIGGPDVMRRQVVSLQDNASRLGAEVGIIPLEAGAYPCQPFTFTVIDLADGDCVAYIGDGREREAVGTTAAAAAYRSRFEEIAGMTLGPPGASRLIDAIAERMAADALALRRMPSSPRRTRATREPGRGRTAGR